MRVFIVSDMEGVAGITKWEQVTGGDPMFEEGRRLYRYRAGVEIVEPRTIVSRAEEWWAAWRQFYF